MIPIDFEKVVDVLPSDLVYRCASVGAIIVIGANLSAHLRPEIFSFLN